jgi:hypothetical protein
MGQIVWASSNNFRHCEDWRAGDNRREKSVAILRKIGIRDIDTSANCCSKVIDKLGLTEINTAMFDVMLQRVVNDMSAPIATRLGIVL